VTIWPSNWDEMTLGEVAKWLSGGTPRTSEVAYWGGEIPWIGSGSLTSFRIRTADRTLTTLGAANGTRLVGPGTVIFVVRGMSLKSEFRMGITQREVAFGQDCKALVAKNGIDPTYLAYAIKALTPDILDLVDEAGHGTGRLNTDQMQALPIGVPPIEEQRGIAATLGAVDDKIESNQKVIELASELLDVMAVKLAPELPTTTLGALVDVQRESIDPARLGDTVVDHFSLPAFDNGVRAERVSASTIMSNKLKVSRRSILLSRLNPRFNRLWWVTPEAGTIALASTEFLCMTAADDQALAAVWLALRDEFFRAEFVRRVTGTSGSHQRVRPDDALAIEVPDVAKLPTKAKGAVLAALESIEQHRKEIVRLTTLRDALMPELLSGRVRVPESAGAAAEVVA
jgi:type I restriction enzyme, S subunit